MALGQGTILVLLMGLGSRLRPQPAAGDEWSYSGPEGEDHWASHFPHCGTTLQSPIDFHSGIFTYNPALEPIQLLGYNLSTTQRLSLTNDGHAVKVTLPPTMHIISMSHRYTAVQLHLHWGSETEPVGSEHTISGVHYPSELHIVHYNSEKYENISMAQDKADGLAVIGILLEIGPFNAAYDQIFKHLKDIQYKGKEGRIMIPGFDIHDLLPGRLDKYFRYNGSLTTPPCYPSVQWTVLKEPVQISSEQLLPVPTFCWGWTHMFTRGRLEKCADVISFKLLELESDLYYSNKGEGNGTEMVDNYRHVQDLGTRAVFISFQEAVNAGQSLSPGVILIIAICCLFGVAIVVAMTIFFLKKRARKTEDGGMVYKAASAADTPAQA